jgi:hypothetical protein
MYQRAFGVTLTCTRIDGVFATRLIVIALELLRLVLYRLRRPAYRWQPTRMFSRRLVTCAPCQPCRFHESRLVVNQRVASCLLLNDLDHKTPKP